MTIPLHISYTIRLAKSMYDSYHMTKPLQCVTFLYFAIYFSTYTKINILFAPSCGDLQYKQIAVSRILNFDDCGYL